MVLSFRILKPGNISISVSKMKTARNNCLKMQMQQKWENKRKRVKEIRTHSYFETSVATCVGNALLGVFCKRWFR